MRKVHKILDFVISLVLWILIILFLVPIVFLLFLYKSCVILIARKVDKHLHPTQPNDTYFSLGDTKQVPIVNVAQIWRVEGLIDLNEFRAHFRSLFLDCPESRRNYLNLYCYLKQFGGYVFKKSVEQIELDKHIILRDMTREGDSSLEEFIVKWMLKEKFPEGRPLWEIVLLHLQLPAGNDDKEDANHVVHNINYDIDGKVRKSDISCGDDELDEIIKITNNNSKEVYKRFETIVLFKTHHCMTDGYGFIHIVDKLTGNTAPYLVEREEETWMRKFKASFYGPKTLMDYVRNVARTPDIFYPLKDRANAKWHMSLNTLDLAKIKGVRRKTRAHFISVMMALSIGALRRYLKDNCKQRGNSIPSHIWTANSLPWPGHPRDTLVNHWSGGVFQVPFKTEDALERVYGTEKFFKFFHDMEMHKTVKRLIIPVTWVLPSGLLRWGHSLDLYYFRYSNAFATLLLSDKPHYMLGRRVKQLYLPLGIKDAVTTSVLFGVSSSHSGQLDLSLLASSEVVPDQAALDKIANYYFTQELEQLHRSVDERIIPILESDKTHHDDKKVGDGACLHNNGSCTNGTSIPAIINSSKEV